MYKQSLTKLHFYKKISLPKVSIKRELQIMLTILLLGVPNLINNNAL